MPCYSPHRVPYEVRADGKRNLLWRGNHVGAYVQPIPCNKCIGCRLEYARNMAARCVLEAQCHAENSFVTLTFDDGKLPPGFDGNLSVVDHQLFMRRLRKWYGKPVRFYMAGEYGSNFGRPHYHYLLFGVDFADKVLATVRNGKRLYTSKSLEGLWPFGFSSIGSVDVDSASYVARYCLKKVGENVERFKDPDSGVRMQVDKMSGEVRVAEFTQMSRGGRTGKGIGATWFDRFRSDLFPSDQLVLNGKVNKPPRYFLNLLEKVDPQMFDAVKQVRAENLPDYEEGSDRRLLVKEECKKLQIKALKRDLK